MTVSVLRIVVEGGKAWVLFSNGESVNTGAATACNPAALAGLVRRAYGWRLTGPAPTPTPLTGPSS